MTSSVRGTRRLGALGPGEALRRRHSYQDKPFTLRPNEVWEQHVQRPSGRGECGEY